MTVNTASFWLIVVTTILMVATLLVSAVAHGALAEGGHRRKRRCTRAPAAPAAPGQGALPGGVGGVGLDITQQPGASSSVSQGAWGQTSTRAPMGVLPLSWTGTEGTLYTVTLTPGAGQGATPVTAALDTGSSRVVLLSGYTPRPGVSQVANPSTGGPCTSTIAYVSQTATVTVVEDTVSLPRVQVAPNDLCNTNVAGVMANAASAGSLTITNFPIAQGRGSAGAINVFGMSAVRSSTTVDPTGLLTNVAPCTAGAGVPPGSSDLYVTPDCFTSTSPQYESPLLQVLAASAAAAGTDVVWSLMLGKPAVENVDATPAGFLAFGPVATPACMTMQYTPLVPCLPNASSALGTTRDRYYVVEVTRAAVGAIGAPLGTYTPVPFPAYMLLDSGTSLVQLPQSGYASTVSLMNSVVTSPTQQVVVVLQGDVTLTYAAKDVSYGPGKNGAFQAMPDGVASQFSSRMDTGILGAVGLWGTLLEFNLTKGVVGFGQPGTVRRL